LDSKIPKALALEIGVQSFSFGCFSLAQHQPLRCTTMSVKIEVYDGEEISVALERFNDKVFWEYRKSWYKRRFGYYEKPGTRRRKKRMMRYRDTKIAQFRRRFGPWNGYGTRKDRRGICLRIGLVGLFDRTTPIGVIGG
jgi:ribosomal protein S21